MRTINNKILTYSELIQLDTFEERYSYLKLDGKTGQDTFGFDRWMNQIFLKSHEWQNVRNYVISRDMGHDLGMDDDEYEIQGRIIVHHMNPIDAIDIANHTQYLLNPEYLICVSETTHNAIHYGNYDLIKKPTVIERTKNDTCPWK